MSYSKDFKRHALLHMKGFIQYVFNVSLAVSFLQNFVHKYNGGSVTTKLNGRNTAECDYVLRCPDFQNAFTFRPAREVQNVV